MTNINYLFILFSAQLYRYYVTFEQGGRGDSNSLDR